MNKETKLEVEGKTVEDAVKVGLKELKVSRDQVKIEILCDEEKGLFGMPGAKMAKIRVTLINNKS
jgi:spoIIIJ-associated protein